jgi:hypothetical protein
MAGQYFLEDGEGFGFFFSKQSKLLSGRWSMLSSNCVNVQKSMSSARVQGYSTRQSIRHKRDQYVTLAVDEV